MEDDEDSYVTMDSILQKEIQKLETLEGTGAFAIANYWDQEIAPHLPRHNTKAVSFNKGYLKVKVGNSLARAEIEFLRKSLLQGLRERFPRLNIDGINFSLS